MAIEQEIADAKAALQLEYGDAGHESVERIAILEAQLSEAKLAESDASSKNEELTKQVAENKKYSSGLEEQLADADVAREAHEKEIQVLKEQLQKAQDHMAQDAAGTTEMVELRNKVAEAREEIPALLL